MSRMVQPHVHALFEKACKESQAGSGILYVAKALEFQNECWQYTTKNCVSKGEEAGLVFAIARARCVIAEALNPSIVSTSMFLNRHTSAPRLVISHFFPDHANSSSQPHAISHPDF